MPRRLVDARRLDGDEHLVVGDRRPIDLPQREHLGPAIGVLDDRLHRTSKLSQAGPTAGSRCSPAMSEASGQTVLVHSGGSGFLGGWCVIELLRRGYDVRTTVRSLAREPQVRAAVGSPGRSGRSADGPRRRADVGRRLARGRRGLRLRLRRLAVSPAQPKDPDELIVPAREGTVRVLRAALDAGVKRVVLTSSVAAIRLADGAASRPLDERDWTDPDAPGLTPYVRSKTIAERAAWELVRERGEEDRLAVVNPGAIIGPTLSDDVSYSLQTVQRLLEGMPGVPRLGFSLVDVRDVAGSRDPGDDGAGGRRRALHRRRPIPMDGRDRRGAARALGEMPRRCRRGRSRTCSSARWRSSTPTSALLSAGSASRPSSPRRRRGRRHGWAPRPIEDSIAETAESLIRHGVVAVPA